MSTYVVATIDACSATPEHDPHLRQPMWPRDDRKPHDPAWLWCLGQYDQQRQNRRVVVEVGRGGTTLVGEGLTLVGSAYREPRETNPVSAGGCDECREPEDFGWDPIRRVEEGAVIACFRHGALAPGWAYEVEVGLSAHENPEVLHVHEAAATESHPAYHPSYWAEFCRCGQYRYRVLGGPWAPWMPWDDEDGPNPALAG